MTDLTTHCVKRRLFVQKLDLRKIRKLTYLNFGAKVLIYFWIFWSLKCTISLIFNAKNEILTENHK